METVKSKLPTMGARPQITPVWNATLMEIFNGDTVARETVYKIFGYMLLPDNPEKVVVVFHSPCPNAGKRFIADMIRVVTGQSERKCSEPEVLQISGFPELTAEMLSPSASNRIILMTTASGDDVRCSDEQIYQLWMRNVISVAFPNSFIRDNKKLWFHRDADLQRTRYLVENELPGITAWATRGIPERDARFRPARTSAVKFQFSNYSMYHNPIIRYIQHAYQMKSGMWPHVELHDLWQFCQESGLSWDKNFTRKALVNVLRMCGCRFRNYRELVRFPSSSFTEKFPILCNMDGTIFMYSRLTYRGTTSRKNFGWIKYSGSAALIKVQDFLESLNISVCSDLKLHMIKPLYDQFCEFHFYHDYSGLPEPGSIFRTTLDLLHCNILYHGSLC